MERSTQGFSSSRNLDLGKEYLYQIYPYLQKRNSPVYGVSSAREIVFENLTYDELGYLLSARGNHLILFGGAWSRNTADVIDYINAAARQYGVKTIYTFDFRMGGPDCAASHIREDKRAQSTYQGSDKTETVYGADYNYLYGELVQRFLTNLDDWVQDAAASERAITYQDVGLEEQTVARLRVPFLFLYNKDNTVDHSGAGQRRERYPIVYALEREYFRANDGGDALYTSPERQDGSTLADYASELYNAVFRPIREDGAALSSFTSADYVRSAYQINKRGHAFKTQNAFYPGEDINIRPITYGQLHWMLDQEGTFLFLFGGAWCANTQAAVATINDYAVANDVTVYMFDIRLDGKYPIDFWGYPRSREYKINVDANPLRFLYVDMVEQQIPNIHSDIISRMDPPVVGYTDSEGKAHAARRVQFPYFFAYNKDAVDEDGGRAPLLAYFEKMFELINTRRSFIYLPENYSVYKEGVFRVISEYAKRVGVTPKQSTVDRTLTAIYSDHFEEERHHHPDGPHPHP